MNLLATAASHAKPGFPIIPLIVLVALTAGVLLLFGWRPLKSRKVSQSPAASAVRATGRGASRVAARTRATTKQSAAQPDDAA